MTTSNRRRGRRGRSLAGGNKREFERLLNDDPSNTGMSFDELRLMRELEDYFHKSVPCLNSSLDLRQWSIRVKVALNVIDATWRQPKWVKSKRGHIFTSLILSTIKDDTLIESSKGPCYRDYMDRLLEHLGDPINLIQFIVRRLKGLDVDGDEDSYYDYYD